MRRIIRSLIGTLLVLLILSSNLFAANLSTTTCPGAGCVDFAVGGAGSIAIQITGTWVGTVTFRSTVDNSVYTSFRVVSIADTTSAGVTTTTANGLFQGTVTGINTIRVVFSAYTSGTAVVTSKVSTQAAKFSGGGGGAGTVTGTGAANQVAVWSSGSAISGNAGFTYSPTTTDTTTTPALDWYPVTYKTGILSVGLPTYNESGVDAITAAFAMQPNPSVDTNQVYYAGFFTSYYDEPQNLLEMIGSASYSTWNSPGSVNVLYGSYNTVDVADGSVNQAWGTQGTVAVYPGAAVVNSYSVEARTDFTGGTLTHGYGFNAKVVGAAATVTDYTHFWGNAVGGKATSAYSFWSDEQGVYRIRSDNTFNSVYQAIPALYNPQFTKYTPGAANYERCIPGCQWESNVAVITTEKGGTGTLRGLRLGDAGVVVSTFTAGLYTPAATSISSTSANSCGTTSPTLSSGSTNTAGKFTVGTVAGTDCTLTFSVAATTGWTCAISNTTTANLVRSIPTSTTTTRFVGTMVAGDVMQYACNPY